MPTNTKKFNIAKPIQNIAAYLATVISYFCVFILILLGYHSWFNWVIFLFAGCWIWGILMFLLQSRFPVMLEPETAEKPPEITKPENTFSATEYFKSKKSGSHFIRIILCLYLPILAVWLICAFHNDYDNVFIAFISMFLLVASIIFSLIIMICYANCREYNATPSKLFDYVLKTLAFICCVLLVFFVFAQAFAHSTLMLQQEFLKSGQGTISEVKRTRGGIALTFADQSTFFSLVGKLDDFKAGDYFEKEKRSFRYLLNGKNIATHERVQHILGWPPFSARTQFCLYSGIILFQWIYFLLYRNSIFIGWGLVEMFKTQLGAPLPRDPLKRLEIYLRLTPMILILLLQVFFYCKIDSWL